MPTPSWTTTFAGLSGSQPASKLDGNFAQATQVTTAQTPLAPTAGGDIGDDGFSARADHKHPPQGATPTVISGTTHTLVAANDGCVLEFTSGSAVTLTLENSLPVGFSCIACQAGAGQITLTPEAGATLSNSSGNNKTRAQWSEVSLRVRDNSGSTAAYVASGDMTS